MSTPDDHEFWDGRRWTADAGAASPRHTATDPGGGGYPRSVVLMLAVGMTGLLAATAVLGFYALGSQFPAGGAVAAVTSPAASPSPTPTQSSSPTPTAKAVPAKKTQPAPAAAPAPRPAAPLTARLSGSYCPVMRIGDTACWHGGLTNTGPRIGRLAMIFVVGGGYTNWFTTHAGPSLSGFYTTAGCTVDAANARILCGAVPSGGSVSVYLEGDVSKAGVFGYAVKFADISSGRVVYIDQNANGTHQVVSWSETITG